MNGILWVNIEWYENIIKCLIHMLCIVKSEKLKKETMEFTKKVEQYSCAVEWAIDSVIKNEEGHWKAKCVCTEFQE